MLAKCPAAAFLQGELKKQGKKKESQAKPARKPARSQTKPARSQTSQEPSQTSQPGAKPNQPESQSGAKPNQPGAKPNQPSQTSQKASQEPNQGAKPNQPESQPEAKPARSQPKSQPGFPLRALALQKQRQLLGVLPNRISRGLYSIQPAINSTRHYSRVLSFNSNSLVVIRVIRGVVCLTYHFERVRGLGELC